MNEIERLKGAVYDYVVHMLLAGHSMGETESSLALTVMSETENAINDYQSGNV